MDSEINENSENNADKTIKIEMNLIKSSSKFDELKNSEKMKKISHTRRSSDVNHLLLQDESLMLDNQSQISLEAQ